MWCVCAVVCLICWLMICGWCLVGVDRFCKIGGLLCFLLLQVTADTCFCCFAFGWVSVGFGWCRMAAPVVLVWPWRMATPAVLVWISLGFGFGFRFGLVGLPFLGLVLLWVWWLGGCWFEAICCAFRSCVWLV